MNISLTVRHGGPWVVAAALLLLAGCPGGTPKDAAETAETKPLPTLIGTWQSTDTFVEDGRTLTEVMLLTLIGERFIESFALYDAEGQKLDDWPGQGGWTADDAMIEKRWHPGEDGSVAKKYFWGDAGRTVMYVQCWECDHHDANFARLKRVPDALPVADLFGTWMFTQEGDEATWTLMISPDETFSLLSVSPDGGRFHISGKGRVDLENYFIHLTELTRHREGREDEPWWDGVGRAAFAPGTDGGIRVSWPLHEPPIMDARAARGEDELEPYGNYWMLFEKVEQ